MEVHRACFLVLVFICAASNVHGNPKDAKVSECVKSTWRGYSCHACDVHVQIDSGPICGSLRLAEKTTYYYSFRGIPYAKPPTGARRFSELEPCDPWTEPLATVEEGPACPQLDMIYGSIPVQPNAMDEDCIYANVHVPITANLNLAEGEEGLPILVNIHGGGYQTGSGNSDLHGPEYFMYKGKVIVISFNYRINVFGFLSLDSDKIPGNNGLRDMYTLLKWVHRNARSFGGNPRNVTLIGQSVGSASVHLLTLSKATKGLFQRGIMISGTAVPNFFSASPKYAKYLADMFLGIVGITSKDPDVIHQQLIEMPLDDIMYANSIAQNLTGLTTFVPVVESKHANFTRIIDDEPITLIGKGRGANIPLILGFTNNEASFFRRSFTYLSVLDRLRENKKIVLSLRLAFGLSAAEANERADKVLQRSFNGSFTLDNFQKCISDMYFVCPGIQSAQWHAALGKAPVYMYEFEYESEFSMVKRALWLKYKGAAHVEDLTYIFRTNTLLKDHVSFPPKTNDDHMKDWMTDFVLNFICCNNPTCIDGASSPWPPVAHNKLRLLSIAKPKEFNMKELPEDYKNLVDFYNSIDPDTEALSKQLRVSRLT